jgi:DNA (cytosine-5)-methyltransferase 1
METTYTAQTAGRPGEECREGAKTDGRDRKEAVRFIDLFAGIGGFRIAAERLGWRCVAFSEIDKRALRIYKENFDTSNEVELGDIRKVDAERIPDFDVLLAGFPCQPFSIAGKRLGFNDTRGTLFYEIIRVLRAKRPKAFLLENVQYLEKHDNGRTLTTMLNLLGREINGQTKLMVTRESLGYHVFYKVLNSKDFGVPQNRERIYIVGFDRRVDFKFPVGNKQSKFIDVKEQLPDYSKYLLPDTPSRREMIRKCHIIRDDGITRTLTTKQDRYPNAGLVPVGGWYRFLTEREMARLQGFPEWFKVPTSLSVASFVFGNAVTVPVVEAILREMEKWI